MAAGPPSMTLPIVATPRRVRGLRAQTAGDQGNPGHFINPSIAGSALTRGANHAGLFPNNNRLQGACDFGD